MSESLFSRLEPHLARVQKPIDYVGGELIARVKDWDSVEVTRALMYADAYELGYTNLLTALDLAGIPLHARDRDGSHPIVVAGGHAAFNPEPIADFVDAAVLGDGEQIVGVVTDIVRDWKRAGRPGGRDGLLE